MITRTPYPTSSTIEVEFEGDINEVQKATDKYFGQFSPFGYQTKIVKDVVYNNIRIVKITRWNNCD